jgi:murein DD-endopeptidase MepM/ murein hydrolase activator NlpD
MRLLKPALMSAAAAVALVAIAPYAAESIRPGTPDVVQADAADIEPSAISSEAEDANGPPTVQLAANPAGTTLSGVDAPGSQIALDYTQPRTSRGWRTGPKPSEPEEEAEPHAGDFPQLNPETAGPANETSKLAPGQSLADLLEDLGLAETEVEAALKALTRLVDPRRLKPGTAVTLNYGPWQIDRDGRAQREFLGLAIPQGEDREISLTRRTEGGFTAQDAKRPSWRDIVWASGVIRSSLYEAALAAGIPLPVLSDAIKAFSYDVDFQRDLKRGDRFEIVYERYLDERGGNARPGNVLYAGLRVGGKLLQVYRHAEKGGDADFFDRQGRSVRKALMRTPIDGARLTSGFGMRMHPLLGYSRMHRGVDFGAPTGTPIMAAGHGTVVELGVKGGYGNYVRIRHNDEYMTAYAHLSRYGRGLKVGQRVQQGQIIGYVGMTGAATGPHLHYEIMRRGDQINPLVVKTVGGRTLGGPELRQFQLTTVSMIENQLSLLKPASAIARERVGCGKPAAC